MTTKGMPQIQTSPRIGTPGAVARQGRSDLVNLVEDRRCRTQIDNIVIQQGEFDWRSLLIDDEAFGKALGEFEDKEDAHAARVAAREEAVKEVEDRADFTGETDDVSTAEVLPPDISMVTAPEEEDSEERTIADYMLAFVNRDWEWFSTMR